MSSTRSAVVVGGGSGIGAAVAARQRAAGIDVVVWDIADTGDHNYMVCDIADPEQVDVATDATLARWGAPQQVTISAGIGHNGLLADTRPDDWDRVMATNAKGVWLAMRSLSAPMVEAGHGSIVAVSSVSARLADRSMGLYCASKAALDMLVRVAAVEWAPAVRVNAIAPGVTDTPMLGAVDRERGWLADVAARTPLDRLGRADDIAEAVLALHATSWVTGQILDCDGGLALHSPINPP